MRLNSGQRRQVLDMMKERGETCPECGSADYFTVNEIWREWGTGYVVPLACQNHPQLVDAGIHTIQDDDPDAGLLRLDEIREIVEREL